MREEEELEFFDRLKRFLRDAKTIMGNRVITKIGVDSRDRAAWLRKELSVEVEQDDTLMRDQVSVEFDGKAFMRAKLADF